MTLIRKALRNAAPRRGGTWHPPPEGATVWMSGKKHVTPEGGIIYPKTLYPKRYYKFGYEKLTNPDDIYDAYLVSEHMDGSTFFKPEYRLFQGQQRRRPNLGYKTSGSAPRFCWKNPEKMLNVWHADDTMVYDHVSTLQRIRYFFSRTFWPGRVLLWMQLYPLLIVKFGNKMERRREPQEVFIDREEYFRNWQTMMYGVLYDHHKYAHMLAKRRQQKWHYDDVTMKHAHH